MFSHLSNGIGKGHRILWKTMVQGSNYGPTPNVVGFLVWSLISICCWLFLLAAMRILSRTYGYLLHSAH